MKYCKKRNAFIALVCALSLFLSMTSTPVMAADTNCVSASTNAIVNQGDHAYCYVSIDSLESLAALDVTVHFDAEKVKIINVYNSVNCTLYDSVINPDSVQISYILDGQGSTEPTNLFYFEYQVLGDAEIGNTYFDITIGEAYDNDLNTIAVSGTRCKFAIAETVTDKSCGVHGTASVLTKIAQEFTVNYDFDTYEIASGTTVITYDSELFEVVEVKRGTFLDGKIVDINSELNGEIYVSFVGTEYNSNKDFISVKFKSIKNTTKTSQIDLRAAELYDVERNEISCSKYTTNVNVSYDEAYIENAPAMRLDGSYSSEDKQITLTVSLEADSKLGAGDFIIKFNPEIVSYHSSVKGFEPSMFLVNDKNVEAGELKFHIVSTEDIVTEERIMTVVFDVNKPYDYVSADFVLGGSNVTDSLTNRIPLNLIGNSVLLEYHNAPGDMDADNVITDSDAIYLLYHTFLPELYPVNQDCDFNGDNEVNDKDAIYLLYHTFLPDLYPINVEGEK